MQYVPNSVSGQCSTSKEHAHIDRSGLDDGTNGDNAAHQLHKANAAELVGDRCLRQGATCFASDIDRDDLIVISAAHSCHRMVLQLLSGLSRDAPCTRSSFDAR